MKLRYVATSFNGRLCVFYLIFTSAKNLHIENLVYNQNIASGILETHICDYIIIFIFSIAYQNPFSLSYFSFHDKKCPALIALSSCLDFRPILECHPHIPLSIHGEEINEAAPERFVERLHRRLPFERLDESVQLLRPCLSALDGRDGVFVGVFCFIVPPYEVIVAFLVCALVLGDAGVFGDASFRHFCEGVHVRLVFCLFLLERVGLAERGLQGADVFDDVRLACEELVHSAEEGLLDVGFGEVWRLAMVFEFVVAAVDGLAVFVGGVPDFRAVPAAAIAAPDFRRVDADAAVAVAAVPAALQFLLYLVEDFGADDGFVVVLDVILWHFAFVLPCFFREEVDGVALLEERIAFVFLVRENAADRALAPVLATAGCRDAPARELGGDGVEGVAREEEAVDFLDGLSLLAVHDEVSVRAFVVTEETLVGHADLAVGEAFPLAPGRVFGDAAAFFLREGAHDGDEEFALRVKRPDVFLACPPTIRLFKRKEAL